MIVFGESERLTHWPSRGSRIGCPGAVGERVGQVAKPGPRAEIAFNRPIAARCDGSHENTMADRHEQARSMIGTWTKTTTAACADKYPATITFSTGTYRGTRGPGQGMVWWDAGIYRLEDTSTLVVGTATDELVTYQIALQADRFEVTDSEGCLVTYRRA